jgi:hypothetical protein
MGGKVVRTPFTDGVSKGMDASISEFCLRAMAFS